MVYLRLMSDDHSLVEDQSVDPSEMVAPQILAGVQYCRRPVGL